MVIGGKDMYRGGMDIYDRIYGEDLGKTMFGRKSHQLDNVR